MNANPVGRPDDVLRTIFDCAVLALQNAAEISEIVSQIFDMIREFFQLIIDSLSDVL